MQANDILAKARGEQPDNWVVFPLLRNKIIIAILEWIGGIILGGGLLALIVPIVVPNNYQLGVGAAIVTTVILGIIGFIFVGSVVLLISDIRRFIDIGKHIIVITDEDFVKQEGAKVVQVPLLHVQHVTARGRAPVSSTPMGDTGERDVPLGQMPSVRSNMLGMFVGRGTTGSGKARRKRMRTPTSLAFVDDRTNTEVTVVNDGVYGDPFAIGAAIKEHVEAAVRHNVQSSH